MPLGGGYRRSTCPRGAEAQLPHIPAGDGHVCVPRPPHTGRQAVVRIAELVVGLFLPTMCTRLLLAIGGQGTAAQPRHHQGQPGLGVPATLGACGGPTVGGR